MVSGSQVYYKSSNNPNKPRAEPNHEETHGIINPAAQGTEIIAL